MRIPHYAKKPKFTDNFLVGVQALVTAMTGTSADALSGFGLDGERDVCAENGKCHTVVADDAPAGGPSASEECAIGADKQDGAGTGSCTLSHDGLKCPTVVNEDNWKGGNYNKYKDTFAVTQTGADVKVTRTDAPGEGWGMDLRFDCSSGAEDAPAESGGGGEVCGKHEPGVCELDTPWDGDEHTKAAEKLPGLKEFWCARPRGRPAPRPPARPSTTCRPPRAGNSSTSSGRTG